jgi:hypothetical protein
MRVEAASPSVIASSRWPKFVASLWSGIVYALLAIAAIEVGVWAGLELSPNPTCSTSIVQRVGKASSRGLKDIGIGAGSSYKAQTGMGEGGGKSFVASSKRASHHNRQRISSGGSADVFDQRGHLRRYTVREHADDSWELTGSTRAAPDNGVAAQIRQR